MCFPFSLVDLTEKNTFSFPTTTWHDYSALTLFLFFILLYSRLFWPKNKNKKLSLCINHFRGNFYGLTGKMRKRSFFAQILTKYLPSHFSLQRKIIKFHSSRNVTSCRYNEIQKSQSCSIFGSRGNRCLQQI